MANAFKEDIHEGFMEVMTSLAADKKYEKYEHYFYGHSLGGALASLALHDVAGGNLFPDK